MSAPLRNAVLAALCSVTAAPLAAQAASSDQFFLVTQAVRNGGTTSSPGFTLNATFPVVGVPRATSFNYTLSASFVSTIETSPVGVPWITGVTPPQAGLNGGTPLVIHGTELDLGTSTSVTIGGVPATANSVSRSRITTVMPTQPQPGPAVVGLTNGGGQAVAPSKLAVLPMLEWRTPPLIGVRSTLRYLGTSGDTIALILGAGVGPQISLPGIAYGLRINPALILAPPPALPVASADGVLEIAIPPVVSLPGLYIQVLSVTSDPSYGPAAFSNYVVL